MLVHLALHLFTLFVRHHNLRRTPEVLDQTDFANQINKTLATKQVSKLQRKKNELARTKWQETMKHGPPVVRLAVLVLLRL